MGPHHSSGVEGEGGLGDETGGNSHGVDVPLTQPSDAQHLVLAVHAQQAEQLVPGPEEIGPQELVVVPAVPGDVVYPGAGSEVAAGQLFHCLEQHRPMLPHALDLAQLLRRGVQHPGQGAETVDQFVGQGIGVAAGIGVEEQQLQQLVVREGVRPGQKFGFQTLAVSVVGAHG